MHIDFNELAELLLRSPINIASGHAFIDLSETPSDINELCAGLLAFGVIGKPEIDRNTVIVNLGDGNFRGDSILFSTLDSFWRKALSLGVLPNQFIIIREKKSSLSADDELALVRQYIAWSEVIKRIENHRYEGKSIWYLPDDNGGKEVIVEIDNSLSMAKSIPFNNNSLNSAEKLIKVMDLDDAQSPERKLILKKAISDFLTEDNSISSIISAGERVYNRYNDLLDLYAKRFSVNKILSEIETKNLEYTTKINDFVSTSQSKAFAIPGALIAVGALAKSGGFWEGLLIIIGLYMIFIITKSSNDVHRESYENLENGMDDAFSRYSQFDEGAEVREVAQNTLSALKIKIKNATDRLDKIDSLAKAMIIIGVIYLLIVGFTNLDTIRAIADIISGICQRTPS